MKLLHHYGAPIGIYFRKHNQNPNSYVIRVIAKGQQTDIGANPNAMQECYNKAVAKRLELAGLSDDRNAQKELEDAYGAFLQHYGIVLKPITQFEFEFSKGEK